MKIRKDYVTNSSSSSFIITNNTDNQMSSEEVVVELFSKILSDAKGRFVIDPHDSIDVECGDHACDGAFEEFIHEAFNQYSYASSVFNTNNVDVRFSQSHH